MVINFVSCSTELSMKFIILINVKMPTIVGILTFISMINTTIWEFESRKGLPPFLMSSLNLKLTWVEHENKLYNLN